MNEKECLKCHYKWISRIRSRPVACPNCKDRNWDLTNERKNISNYHKCELCKGNFLLLHVHHKDGKKYNNNDNNLIKICGQCHSIIHHGITKKDRCDIKNGRRFRKYGNNPELIEKLLELRKIWIRGKENE